MAKMFYTLKEAADKLGVDQDQVKNMAATGRLQQFRDRDSLMFKREQVDAIAASAGTAADESGSPIELTDSSDTDAIDLKGDTAADKSRKEDPRHATGISVFDADEVEPVDPSAQTQVTSPVVDDEELVLESVGSGSGLLDLTRESDDTSLGAELLDEIYPGGGEGSDAKMESAVGSSGVFDGAIAIESGPSGLENLQAGGEAMPAVGGGYASYAEPDDPAGSGLGAGLLLGATVSLVIGLTIAVSAVVGVPSDLTRMISESLWVWAGGLAVGSLIFGVVGFAIGKSRA